jgi:proteasome lid subunit RPN8/RPN11
VTEPAKPQLDPEATASWTERNRGARHPGAAATVLRLAAQDLVPLRAWAVEGHPHEVCGLLVGRLEGTVVHTERITQAPNLAEERSRDRYELDPEAFLAADHAAREEGLEIVGIWHSHPGAPAMPSLTDLERAWEGYSYVIVSTDGSGSEVRSWRLEDGRFREEGIHLA